MITEISTNTELSDLWKNRPDTNKQLEKIFLYFLDDIKNKDYLSIAYFCLVECISKYRYTEKYNKASYFRSYFFWHFNKRIIDEKRSKYFFGTVENKNKSRAEKEEDNILKTTGNRIIASSKWQRSSLNNKNLSKMQYPYDSNFLVDISDMNAELKKFTKMRIAGYSIKEIASELGITEATFFVRLQKVKSILKPQYIE